MEYSAVSPEKIGATLRNLRGQVGETLEQTAKAIGISLSAFANYESGNRIPRDEIKIRIAKHYGLTVESIFFPKEQHETCYYEAVLGQEPNKSLVPQAIPDPLNYGG